MTTEYDDIDDPYLRPYQPDLEDGLDYEDGEDDEIEAVDLEEAAADFRMRYYGPENNPQPPAAMAELAPDVMRLVDAVVYGEIYNRPAVDLKTRSLCTIAALVVLGHSPQMIKRHITGALHIGVTEEEISEIIAQMVFYGGMPAAVNAFRIAKETFDEQNAKGAAPAARPDAAPSGFAPPYRRENVRDDAPEEIPGNAPRPARPRIGPGQETGYSGGPARTGFDRGSRQQGQPDRREGRDRREGNEDRVHRNRQHGQSDGRQPDSGRPPANRPRPAARGRNQPPGDGRRVGGQPQRGRPGQRRGPNNQPSRPQGRRGGNSGRGRGPGGRR